MTTPVTKEQILESIDTYYGDHTGDAAELAEDLMEIADHVSALLDQMVESGAIEFEEDENNDQ